MQERWRICFGFDTHEVSDLGRVRNQQTQRLVKGSCPKPGYTIVRFSLWPEGRWPTGISRDGDNSKRRKRHTIRVHQLVLEAFVGPAPSGYEALHRNGKKADNRLSNLRWGTSTENKTDAKQHGVTYRSAAKLTPAKAARVRALIAKGHSQREIACRFGITQSNVSYINRGLTW